jgi:Na+-driven multidrug efflux pump
MPLTSVVVGATIILLRTPLVSLFNFEQNISEYTLVTAESILIICGIWYIVRNVPYLTVVGIFRPGGDTMMGMAIELVVLWLFSVPLTFIAANILGLPFIAVYAIMYLAEDLPKSIIFLTYYRSCKWLKPVTEAGVKALEEFKR